MRILMVGAGATGGYFGGRLAQAGKDLTFLVRPGRAAALASRGLRIKGPGGETVLAPRLVTADDLDGHYDLVVVSVKSYALDAAIRDFGPAIGPHTVVVPLLNGIRHLGTLSEAFGTDRVYGGVCMIHATLDDDGDVVQLTGLHRIVLGPLGDTVPPQADGPSARAESPGPAGAVVEALSGAEFSVAAVEDIVQEMWEKWVFLASTAAATTLLGASIGEINAAPGGRSVTSGIAAESVAIATAAGHPPGDFWRSTLESVISSAEPTTSSMFRDMAGGAPVEADTILGDFVAEAGRLGVPVPLLTAAYTHLAIYQARRG